MKTLFTIINPGFFSTVQDEGRWGYQVYGMPVAGAIDRYAYNVANLLAGNQPGAAAIEMTMLGGTFRFNDSRLVAICGADMQAALDGAVVPNWSAFTVPAGSELAFGYAVSGCRAYLAVQGGVDVPRVLNSRSTYTRAAVGGLQGRALLKDDVLNVGQDNEADVTAQVLAAQYVPSYGENISLRVLLGPQDDMFTADAIQTFFTGEYTISNEADRMGYRLEGPKITHVAKADIVSDALCLGAIQVPAHGVPIIMLADRQTTGGYAKIGAVISPDLTKLAQAKPGDRVRFQKIEDREAVAALREEREAYLSIRKSLQGNITTGNATAARLYNVTVNGTVYSVEVKEIL